MHSSSNPTRKLVAAGVHNGFVAIDVNFMVVLRGYDIKEVDALVRQVQPALKSQSVSLRAAAREALRSAAFRIRIRGYNREHVDAYLSQAAKELA
jgi:DivIVA domain-containing protein